MAEAKDTPLMKFWTSPSIAFGADARHGLATVGIVPDPHCAEVAGLAIDVSFSNSKTLKLQQKYLTPVWRRTVAHAPEGLQNVGAIALEFKLPIDESTKAVRTVQAIAQPISEELAEDYLGDFKANWIAQNEEMPPSLKSEVIFEQQDDQDLFRSFAFGRLNSGSARESVAGQFVVDIEHGLFLKLSYSSRLAAKTVFYSLKTILQGNGLEKREPARQ